MTTPLDLSGDKFKEIVQRWLVEVQDRDCTAVMSVGPEIIRYVKADASNGYEHLDSDDVHDSLWNFVMANA